MKVTLTIHKSDGSTMSQKASGGNDSEDRNNAMLGIWKRLDLSARNAKDKKWEKFNTECGKKGHRVVVSKPSDSVTYLCLVILL